MFVDEVVLKVMAGAGGDGCTAFRREKYIEMGGPFGGNGGRGSDIVFQVDEGLHTLLDLRYQKQIKGAKGENGRGKNQHGKNSSDVIVKVPQGTVVTDLDTGLIICDLKHKGESFVVAKGGRGGRGNTAFKTQTNTAPDFSENGEPGEEKTLKVEVKMLADVGLVGLPSVGKSTIISCVSRSKPKIAAYHFTTLTPNLGVSKSSDGRSFVIADLPGLIEGASQGEGLGDKFLRHIERCRVIVHIIDMGGIEGRDPYEDYCTINEELGQYQYRLLERPQIVVANKMDEENAEENLKAFKEKVGEDVKVFPISAIIHEGVDQVLYAVADALETAPKFDMEEVEENTVVYNYEEEEAPFVVHNLGNGQWTITGKKIERLVSMTSLVSDDAIKRLSIKMRNMGIDEALRNAGCQDGDVVSILDFEFEFYD